MTDSAKGCFLVSSPSLTDPNFSRTVVLITEHSAESAFGLVLNRPGKHKVSDLWASLDQEPTESPTCSFVGGPVQPNAVFLLHTCEELAAQTEPVLPGLFLGGDVKLLGELLAREKRLREEGRADEFFRVFCGYSGWGEGQLDRELEMGGWLVQPASTEFIFSNAPEMLWQRTMERAGGPYKFFSLMPPNPEMN